MPYFCELKSHPDAKNSTKKIYGTLIEKLPKKMWVKVIVYYLKSLGWDLFDVAIDCDDEQIKLIEWFCQHGVHSSGLSSSTESFNVSFVQISFSTVILSYTYGV